jgi:hypothetical protein
MATQWDLIEYGQWQRAFEDQVPVHGSPAQASAWGESPLNAPEGNFYALRRALGMP